MAQRFTINEITAATNDWTCKVQVIDKGRQRDNQHGSKKYQLLILQDEETVANVKEANNVYGKPISDFIWIIDRNTIVEPIEKLDPT
ncbi:hypothetical protein P3L10_018935 [Capsicum annuum]